jgi:hypothetical protein
MYIIDRLNDAILQQYHVMITSSVSVFEDGFKNEECKFLGNSQNPDAKYITDADNIVEDLKEFILDYIDTFVDTDMSESTLYDIIASEEEPYGFYLSSTLTERNNQPTDAETAAWEDGKIFLYNHEFLINVVINGSKISNEILLDLIFTNYKFKPNF